eukprot:gene14895-16441_t
MSAIKTTPLSEDEKQRLKELYIAHQLGQSFIRTTPGNWVLSAAYEKYKSDIYNLKLRPDDTFVLTWPKNGATWAIEMVWCILHDIDLKKAKNIHPLMKVPFLERPALFDFLTTKRPGSTMEEVLTRLESMPANRVIKSHLHLELLPPKLLDECKAVLCLRNPKDTIVSYYHHNKLIKAHNFVGDFKSYFNLFMDNLLYYSSYWRYTVDAWKLKDHPNVCLLFFEDMKQDLQSAIKKVASFLDKELTDAQVKSLEDHLSFKSMKECSGTVEDGKKLGMFVEKTEKDAHFFRKGEVGDWKNYFTEEMNKKVDDEIEKHFKNIGLKFRYE